MDWNAIASGVIAVAALLAAGLSLWNFFQSPTRKNAEDLAAYVKANDASALALRKAVGEDIKLLDTAVDDTKARVATLETVMKEMPTKDMLHRMEMSVAELNNKFTGLAASAAATERTAHRVEEFLLNAARK